MRFWLPVFELTNATTASVRKIFKDLNATKLKLITNNPTKRVGLSGHGIEIVETVPIIIPPKPENELI